MAEWNFLTNHALALLCVARDPSARLRDIAATLDISERRAFGIVTDLTRAGYLVKARDGRRNRYEIEHHLPLPDAPVRERTVGELLDLLASVAPDTKSKTKTKTKPQPRRSSRARVANVVD